MKTLKQLLFFTSWMLLSIKLIGQYEMEGYRNGLQITGKKIARNLSGAIEWKDRDSTIYEFDNQQRLIKREELYFNDTIWIAHARTLLEYEEKGYVRTDQRFYADVFMEDIHKITQVFNDHQQLIESIEHDWINETWIRYSKTEYQYDEDGNIIHKEDYRFVNNEWALVWQEIFEFDALGNQVLCNFRQFNLAGIVTYEKIDKIEKDTLEDQIITNSLDLFDGELRVYNREVEFLNSNNIVDSSYIYWNYWDTLELSAKIIYDYNNIGQLTQSISYRLNNNHWNPFNLINYDYDNNGNLILEKSFQWSTEEGNWVDYLPLQKEYAYNENGSLIKEVDYTAWAIEYEPWIAYDRNITYYAAPLSVSVEAIPKNLSVQIFPNPTNHFLTVKLAESSGYPLHLTLVNLQGQILKQQEVNANLVTINLEEVPKGAYFVQVQDEFGKMIVSKIMKQ